MDKIKQQVLADYKKANKSAKERMLKKYGFSNEADFLKEFELNEEKVVEEPKEDNAALDLVVAFDTTGSMSSYIGSVKKHVEKLVGDLFSKTPNLKMKIVAFGDYCDMESESVFGKAYQFSQLTDNQNDLVKFVKSAKDTSGGDSDEFYELVIKKIVEETEWREGAKKSVLLIGDAAPHRVGYSFSSKVQNAKIDWKQEAAKAASLGIQFDTLRIHESQGWYAELSKTTGGVCMEFKNANKISQIIEGTTYVRGSKKEFKSKLASVMKSGDAELIGAYKTISTLLD